MLNDRKLLFGLHQTSGIGWKTIRTIVQSVRPLSDIVSMNTDALVSLGIAENRAKLLDGALSKEAIESKLHAYREAGVRILTIFDEEYPELLKQIPQPPWVLYCKGDTKSLARPMIAMVGTRTPTVYGRKAAHMLAYRIAEAGICVVSGFARGVDSDAHLGALSASGQTIAVLGTGVDLIYPRENEALYAGIAKQGLLVSEYPLGTQPQPGLFPLRNRIIAGLSLGTVVVEAALRSGSLITADQALEYDRDVFAVPGPITSPKSAGTHSLIKQGAKTVTCAEDILEEYRHMINLHDPINALGKGANGERKDGPELTEEERIVLRCIGFEPVGIDELLEKSKVQFGLLHSVLLSLTMKNTILQLPGSTYVIKP